MTVTMFVTVTVSATGTVTVSGSVSVTRTVTVSTSVPVTRTLTVSVILTLPFRDRYHFLTVTVSVFLFHVSNFILY